jgi:cytochrome c oxidase cbb3-type subunit 3
MSESGHPRDEIQGEILHVYDDIQEADNQLPTWWVAVFLGTVAFAGVYWFAHLYHAQPTVAEDYRRSMDALQAAQAEALRNQPEVSAALLHSLASNAQAIAQGSAAFKQTCAPCHADRAQGNIGPNLTDNFWLHGGSGLEIHKTISEGVVAKGMPAWGAVLGENTVRNLTAFVLSLRGQNVPGKPAQGEPYVAEPGL